MEDYTIKCPNCGIDTGIDPAFIDDEIPVFCPVCKEQIFIDEPSDD